MSQHVSLDLISAMNHARHTKAWVVVVCPNDSQMMTYRRTLAASITSEDRYSGRTAKLHGGGTLSVVSQVDEPFQPDGQPITVAFFGLWSQQQAVDRMHIWRKAAAEIL
jgi:hypothetical protein